MIPANLSKLLTLEDVLIAARTAAGEGRSGGFSEMRMVAGVMVNRWKAGTGQFLRDDTLATACLRHQQFSAWNAADPNLPYMTALDMRDPLFRLAISAVLAAIDGEADPTFGATHYHTRRAPALNQQWPPAWATGFTPCAETQLHLFYRGIP